MTVAESNGPPAPVGSLRLGAGTHATSGNEFIGDGESARRAGDRGRTTCGRVTVAVKKSRNHEGHEEHEGMRGGDPMSVGSRRECVGSGDERPESPSPDGNHYFKIRTQAGLRVHPFVLSRLSIILAACEEVYQ